MRVLITGAAGTIGKVLMKVLSKKFDVVGIDKVSADGVVNIDMITDTRGFNEATRGMDAAVHLAWDLKENMTALSPVLDENKKMAELFFDSALESGVKRVIIASSVHASLGHIRYKHPGITADHALLHRKRKIGVDAGVWPLGIYGASKVYIEALGRVYASRGMQVIAVRFGNVTKDDSHGEYPFWLSHRDCVQFVEKCLTAEKLPDYSVFFAISNNTCNPFDIGHAKRLLGYAPEDDSPCPENR